MLNLHRLIGFASMTVLMASHEALATPAEEAKVAAVISAVAVYADNRDFTTLEGFFAPETLIDYTSLWGGEARRLTPRELMAAWSGLLPGFDATRHQLSDINVELDGEQAIAAATVTATHWLENATWTVSGTYDYVLVRRGSQWRVSAMTFHLADENGDRGLVQKAADRIDEKAQ
ncbi:nuclear transport factor 2 family protein [Rhizobium sp. LCM 4573]|uniref:nuclear transport factor 2 family protein n=1 Tax=Rhizobium sp. LCM 4573 TaxID=1848291 RepID=UPI0008DA7806|nr:nuclear transport factor 2 family protein [Rhizobium sp. LCM 4573]OHV84894.1 hypothetical protein LCM4573_04390 [Rhizobium sp. LCM 4573]